MNKNFCVFLMTGKKEKIIKIQSIIIIASFVHNNSINEKKNIKQKNKNE